MRAVVLEQLAVAWRARLQGPYRLTVETTHLIVTAAMLEPPGQQIADRVQIAFQNLAITRFDDEHRVYQ